MSNPEKTFRLNRRRAMLGGVCAGLADYLALPVLLVRVAFVLGAMVGWPIAVFAYVVTCCCFSEGNGFRGFFHGLMNLPLVRHFKAVDYSKPIYKSRHRKIAGVCAGVANYLEINPWLLRIAAVLSIACGPFVIIAYFIAAFVMNDEAQPERSAFQKAYLNKRQQRREEWRQLRRERWARRAERRKARRERRQEQVSEFNKPVEPPVAKPAAKDEDNLDDALAQRVFSYRRQYRKTQQKFDRIEKQLQRLEAVITSKKFQLHCDFKRMGEAEG